MEKLSDFQRRTTRGIVFNGLLVITAILIFKLNLFQDMGGNYNWLIITAAATTVTGFIYGFFIRKTGLSKNADAINKQYESVIPKRIRTVKEKLIAVTVIIASSIAAVSLFIFIKGNQDDLDTSFIVFVILPALGFASIILDMMDLNTIYD